MTSSIDRIRSYLLLFCIIDQIKIIITVITEAKLVAYTNRVGRRNLPYFKRLLKENYEISKQKNIPETLCTFIFSIDSVALNFHTS